MDMDMDMDIYIWICIYGSQQPKQQQLQQQQGQQQQGQTTNNGATTTSVLLSIICSWIYYAVNLGVRSGMNESNHLQSYCRHQFKTTSDFKLGSALII